MKNITTKMKIFIATLLVVIFLMYQIEPPTSTQPQTNNKDGAHYSIISDEYKRDIKRTVEVRLRQKVSEENLEGIAYKIKKLAKQKTDRTFIIYFLPHMTPPYDPWAVTSFNPNFEIALTGTTIEQEQKITAQNRENIIGIWLQDNVSGGRKHTLYKENDSIFMKRVMGNGYTDNYKVIASQLNNKMRYEKENKGDGLFYYIVDQNGDLKFYDQNGIFSEQFKKIK